MAGGIPAELEGAAADAAAAVNPWVEFSLLGVAAATTGVAGILAAEIAGEAPDGPTR